MADNITIKDGADADATVATKDVGGVEFQEVIVADAAGTPLAFGTAGTSATTVLTVQGIASGTAQPVSATALPLPTGAATAAKQPALGTAGSAASDVISVQGISGGTALPISAASLPLPSGAATAAGLGATTDAAVVSDSNGSAVSFLRGLVKILATVWKNVTGAYYAIQVVPVDAAGAAVYAEADVADDAAFSVGTTKVAMIGLLADEAATDSVDEGDGGAPRMTLDRKVIVTPEPHTAGGLSTFRSLDVDESEEEVKATAGQLYGWYMANLASSIRYVKLYDATTANVDVGTTVAKMTFVLPANSTNGVAANALGEHGITFGTAITVAATTGLADTNTGAPGTNEVVVNLFYK